MPFVIFAAVTYCRRLIEQLAASSLPDCTDATIDGNLFPASGSRIGFHISLERARFVRCVSHPAPVR